MKLAFSDFWPGWDDHSNFPVTLFGQLGIAVQIVQDDSDLLIASCCGYAWTGKIQKTREHKFAMAFENSAYACYLTEKLVDALVSDAVPIYWGGSAVASEFNDQSFIDVGALGVQPALEQTPLAQRIGAFCLSFERAARG